MRPDVISLLAVEHIHPADGLGFAYPVRYICVVLRSWCRAAVEDNFCSFAPPPSRAPT